MCYSWGKAMAAGLGLTAVAGIGLLTYYDENSRLAVVENMPATKTVFDLLDLSTTRKEYVLVFSTDAIMVHLHYGQLLFYCFSYILCVNPNRTCACKGYQHQRSFQRKHFLATVYC